ncbi:uncharacterized protein LOC129595308 [Paramacrobiotus metropolitanus]|uniref:uncharacterized protein LOC129595308 n=1 Tax=Paramacrobiotus metropolitanus TaxID=2943436 RepID=UPI0024460B4B|nr:uncharacterized protein LOC129595308 [Paramacrobiotus metropolitanus]
MEYPDSDSDSNANEANDERTVTPKGKICPGMPISGIRSATMAGLKRRIGEVAGGTFADDETSNSGEPEMQLFGEAARSAKKDKVARKERLKVPPKKPEDGIFKKKEQSHTSRRGKPAADKKELLHGIKISLNTKGADKMELFPGAARYLPRGRLMNFKAHWHRSHPMTDAVNLACMIFGTTENILLLFDGAHFGLKAALGADVVRDLPAFINSEHPGIVSGSQEAVKEELLYKAFSRKVWYLRTGPKTGTKDSTPEL